MKALILATALAVATPTEPAPSFGIAPKVWCDDAGRELAAGVAHARREGVGINEFLARRELSYPDDLEQAVRLDRADKLTVDTVFILYPWPFEVDPDRIVAERLAANMCMELFKRGADMLRCIDAIDLTIEAARRAGLARKSLAEALGVWDSAFRAAHLMAADARDRALRVIFESCRILTGVFSATLGGSP